MKGVFMSRWMKVLVVTAVLVTGCFLVGNRNMMKPEAKASTLWTLSEDGIKTASLPLAYADSGEQIHLVHINQNRYRAEILTPDRWGGGKMTVKEMAEKSGASAAVNASYFGRDGHPLGYLKVGGKTVNDYIATPIIYSGIITFSGGKISVVHRDGFSASACSEALQVGPRLIADSKMTAGIENTIDYEKKARRAGLAVDGDGNAVLFSTYYALAGWKQIVDTFSRYRQLRIVHAINLDGGSSTQIYVRRGKISVDEGSLPVPVAIGFFPKKK